MSAVMWVPITPAAYREIWNSFVPEQWTVFACYTDPQHHGPADQETNWGLKAFTMPVLKNKTYNGVHSYFLAVAVSD